MSLFSYVARIGLNHFLSLSPLRCVSIHSISFVVIIQLIAADERCRLTFFRSHSLRCVEENRRECQIRNGQCIAMWLGLLGVCVFSFYFSSLLQGSCSFVALPSPLYGQTCCRALIAKINGRRPKKNPRLHCECSTTDEEREEKTACEQSRKK